jgi:phage regulator Rha-like protein
MKGVFMNELVLVKGNNIFTDSLVVSEGTNNTHRAIRILIDRYKSKFESIGRLSFKMTPLQTKGGVQNQKIYHLNEQQATFLMTLLRNNDLVVDFKLKLTKEFYRMRQFILEKQSAEWKQSRLTGKQIRKDETDSILTKLIPLAESQGSKNSGELYRVYSKLVNKTLDIMGMERSNLSAAYIDAIKFLERAIENIISLEADKGTYYKEIFQICKAKCQIIKDLAFLPSIKQIGA